ncbi:hypothetical protein FW800_00305 [Pseudomonas sp. 910_23]|nr:hypothetical protein [Pseudomonas sp. W2Aug9]
MIATDGNHDAKRAALDLDLRRPVKPRWPKSMADCGHTEPKRGAEWWGKSPFGYFWLGRHSGLFSKSDPL